MTLSRNFRNIALVSVSLVGLMGFVDAASASWASQHPRRAEVNHRLNHQASRIAHQVIKGNLSAGRAAKLLHKDAQLRREERVMASLNGGHITKADKKALNQQENKISKRIP